MNIDFDRPQDRKLCENFKRLVQKYGPQRAELIVKRLNELYSAESLYDITRLPQARFHTLSGNYAGCCAVDLKHPYRVVFRPLNGDMADLRTVTKISVKTVCVDYH